MIVIPPVVKVVAVDAVLVPNVPFPELAGALAATFRETPAGNPSVIYSEIERV